MPLNNASGHHYFSDLRVGEFLFFIQSTKVCMMEQGTKELSFVIFPTGEGHSEGCRVKSVTRFDSGVVVCMSWVVKVHGYQVEVDVDRSRAILKV